MKNATTHVHELLQLCQQLNACSDSELQVQLKETYVDCSQWTLQAFRLFLHSSCYLPLKVVELESPDQIHADAECCLAALSRREREVLSLLESGNTLYEIGERLFISRSTVNNHCSRIREKLGLRGRNALMTFAWSNRDIIRGSLPFAQVTQSLQRL